MKKKARILYVATFPPPIHGSAMMSEYIKDSNLVNSFFEGDYVNLGTSRSMDEIGKRGLLLNLMKLYRFSVSFLELFWKLLIHRYDLCYCAITCRGTGFLKDAPFVLLCKLFRRKIAIHQHNKGMSKCVDRKPYKWLLPLVYKNTKVILLSWNLYTDIEKIVKREQVLICHNGIPEIPQTNNISELDKTIPQILFLSNLITSKGVYILLDACKILKEKGLKFRCNFVGGESKEINRQLFEEEVKNRRLDDVVVYYGPKYGDEKFQYLSDADVFVQPTYEDCFPLTILEAMQYSLPVVSTDEGGIPDIVRDGENGYICKRKDVVSIADALEKLINNPKLRKDMGLCGYTRYQNLFTVKAFEQRFVEVINRCCK